MVISGLGTTICDAIMRMCTLVIVKWSVEDFLGCRLATWHSVFPTTIIRMVIIHIGGATADALGAAASLAEFFSLNLTGRGTCIDSYSALGRLKLASGGFIRRDVLCLLG